MPLHMALHNPGGYLEVARAPPSTSAALVLKRLITIRPSSIQSCDRIRSSNIAIVIAIIITKIEWDLGPVVTVVTYYHRDDCYDRY